MLNRQNGLCIGVISDTHGLLREEVKERFKGVNCILHAGDIGSPNVLQELKEIAPVYAVRGNCDREQWARDLPVCEWIEIDGKNICLIHDLQQLNIDPKVADIQVVVSGHTHQAACFEKDQVLYINPGSAGPRRFNLPVTMGFLFWKEDKWFFDIDTLKA